MNIILKNYKNLIENIIKDTLLNKVDTFLKGFSIFDPIDYIEKAYVYLIIF